jgi:hypothetical protein
MKVKANFFLLYSPSLDRYYGAGATEVPYAAAVQFTSLAHARDVQNCTRDAGYILLAIVSND